MGVLDLICCDIGCLLEVHELCPEDDGEPKDRIFRTFRAEFATHLRRK